ncbi:MAG: SgcJ/EcaC family oxidoreductase [Candidatus Baltobacteraceae bacterium]
MSNRSRSSTTRFANSARLIAATFLLMTGAQWPAQADEPPQVPAAIRNVIATYEAAWDRSDSSALAAQYVPDGDLMIPTGEVFSGPQTIAAFYTSVFKRGYSGTHGVGSIDRFRYLSSNMAVVDGTWGILGVPNVDKGSHDERGLFTAFLVNVDGNWRIAGLREQSSGKKINVVASSRP